MSNFLLKKKIVCNLSANSVGYTSFVFILDNFGLQQDMFCMSLSIVHCPGISWNLFKKTTETIIVASKVAPRFPLKTAKSRPELFSWSTLLKKLVALF